MRALDHAIAAPVAGESLDRNRLEDVLGRQELFLRGAHVPHAFTDADLQHSHAAWFGVGVTAGKGLTRGLPLDVLGLVYAQEFVRRALDWDRSVVLVADSNAQAAGADALATRRLAVRVERRLRQVCARLGFPVDVLLTSTLGHPDALPGFDRLRALPPYVAHQLAQTERLRKRGAGMKIGWAWRGAVQDERYFDDLHAREYGRRIAAVYTGGGATLDPRRPRACPYVCSSPAHRLLLHPGEDLERKLATASRIGAQRYQRLLGKLTRAHCRLTGVPRPRRITTPLQDLLDDLPCAT